MDDISIFTDKAVIPSRRDLIEILDGSEIKLEN